LRLRLNAGGGAAGYFFNGNRKGKSLSAYQGGESRNSA
jgi:hypothetical protein